MFMHLPRWLNFFERHLIDRIAQLLHPTQTEIRFMAASIATITARLDAIDAKLDSLSSQVAPEPVATQADLDTLQAHADATEAKVDALLNPSPSDSGTASSAPITTGTL